MLSQIGAMKAVRRRNARNFKTLGRLLRFQAMVATTLCHEVIYALGHAMWCSPTHFEPYYCDQRLNELGFAWETAVFGGTISDTLDSACFYPLNFSTWPFIGDGGEGPVKLRGQKRRPKHYFVPMAYVNTILQQAF